MVVIQRLDFTKPISHLHVVKALLNQRGRTLDVSKIRSTIVFLSLLARYQELVQHWFKLFVPILNEVIIEYT